MTLSALNIDQTKRELVRSEIAYHASCLRVLIKESANKIIKTYSATLQLDSPEFIRDWHLVYHQFESRVSPHFPRPIGPRARYSPLLPPWAISLLADLYRPSRERYHLHPCSSLYSAPSAEFRYRFRMFLQPRRLSKGLSAQRRSWRRLPQNTKKTAKDAEPLKSYWRTICMRLWLKATQREGLPLI